MTEMHLPPALLREVEPDALNVRRLIGEHPPLTIREEHARKVRAMNAQQQHLTPAQKAARLAMIRREAFLLALARRQQAATMPAADARGRLGGPSSASEP